ncbi:MAG: integrase, partial [Pedobacter sp.]
MLINDFLTYLQYEKRYSPHTLQAYRADLLQFEDFLKSESENNIETAKVADIK